MELVKVDPIITSLVNKKASDDNFIVSNTSAIELEIIRNDCIIPNFAKDNESTISHAEFIDAVAETVSHVFQKEEILIPAVRVSHPIKGRIPEAMGKPAKELLPYERTLYYERMAFAIEIPSIRETIMGNSLSLVVGGIRSYNLENLYSRKSLERFKIFIGFKNFVCTNYCISTDGFIDDLRVSKPHELIEGVYNLAAEFNVVQQLNNLKALGNYSLSESQFAQVLGKMKMYPYLPKGIRSNISPMLLGDSQLSALVKAYYQDENFNVAPEGDVDLFRFYNLCTGANKSSYIDSFLNRGVSLLNLSNELKKGLIDKGSSWYLS